MRKLIVCCAVLLAIPATAAFAARGSSSNEMTLSIGLSHGSGEYAEPVSVTGDDFILVGSIPELGFNVDLAKMMAPDYALALGFDYRFGNVKMEPTTNAPAGTLEEKTTSSSWKIRLGGDRIGNIGDRFKWYFGPGLEYKSGKAKFENFAAPPNNSVDGENTNAYGINGRVGGVMWFNPTAGVYGQIGDTVGMASVKDTGGKTSWYYSSFEAAWGLHFKFGAK